MADRYWVGGAGTWDATTTTNWSATSGGAGGASAPTSADNVIFNTLSNATAYAVTVGTNAAALDITIAGPAVGNVTITMGATAVINCYGSWTNAATGVVVTGTSGATISFLATATGKTVTTNNVTFTNMSINFNGVGGGWTLGSAFTNTTNGLNVLAGSFSTGNYSLSCIQLATSGTATRSISLGSSAVTLAATTAVSISGTNLTFNAGTSTITCNGTTQTFAGGGQTFYNVSFTSTATGTTTIQNANTFNNLTQTSLAATGRRTVIIVANQTISGTLTLGAANTSIRRVQVVGTTVTGVGVGTAVTLTVATIATLADVDFRDIVAAGASGTWSGTRLGNAGNNSNITFAAGVNKYWNLAAGGNWTSTAWALTSGGAVDVNNYPLAQDTAIIEDTGLTAGNTITVNENWFIGTLDASTRTTAFTLASTTSIPTIYGNYTIPSVATTTGTGSWYFQGIGVTQNITTNGVSVTFPINCNGSTANVVRLVGNLTTTASATLQQGTLNLNNNVLSSTTFTAGSGTNTLAFGTGNITLTSTGTIFTGSTTTTVTGTPQVICTDSSATSRTITPGVVTEANSISFRITAGTGALGITAGSVRNLDFTDGTNPTGFGGNFNNNTTTVYGNFKASTSGMTASAGTAALTFAATSGTKTIDAAGVVFDRPFTFNGVGGTWQLQSNLIAGPSPAGAGSVRTTTLTAGTLNLNGFTLTTGLFSSTGTGVRTLAFGTGNITITGVSATIFDTTTVTNMTITGTPVVNCTGTTGTSVQTRTFIVGNHGEAQSISVNINPGTSAVDIFRFATNSGAFKDVTFSSTFTGTVQISNTIFIYGNLNFGGATTYVGVSTITFAATSGTKTINTSGLTIESSITFNGVGGTWQLQAAIISGATRTTTLTNGTLDLVSYTLTTGLFNSNNSNTRSIAFGTGKIVLTGNSATVWSSATGTGFTYTGTSRIEAFGPATTGTRVLNPSSVATSTEATAMNFYITGGSDTVNFGTTNRRINNMDFTGFTGTFINSQQTVHGNYTISTGMTVGSGTEITTFATTTSQNITTNGKTLDFPVTFDGVGGSWALQDALTLGSTQPLTMTNGTLQLKAGTTNTVGSFVTSGTTQKYLQSTTSGSQATISDASGTNSVSYLTIQDSNATGGAAWTALFSNNNVSNGNNTGWLFNNVIAGNIITETATGTDAVASLARFFSSLQETATGTDAVNGRPYWDVIDDTQTANWQNIGNTQSAGWTLIST